MIILALDIATKTGWCVIADGVILASGVVNLRQRGEPVGMIFCRWRKWLKDAVYLYKPTRIVYEQAHLQGAGATLVIVGNIAYVHEVCAVNDIKLKPKTDSIHSGTIKKYIAGSGRADKNAVIAAVIAKTGIKPADDNEADAIALGLCAAEKIDGAL